jgi:hypothetical protein
MENFRSTAKQVPLQFAQVANTSSRHLLILSGVETGTKLLSFMAPFDLVIENLCINTSDEVTITLEDVEQGTTFSFRCPRGEMCERRVMREMRKGERFRLTQAGMSECWYSITYRSK